MQHEPCERVSLSINEAAASAGISRGLLYALIRDGEGPRTLKLGRRRVVTIEALREWLRDREATQE